jgi:cell division septation protein DedD
MAKKTLFLTLPLLCSSLLSLFGQTAPVPSSGAAEDITVGLHAAAQGLPAGAEKKAALALLGNVREQLGLYASAAEAYQQAAFASGDAGDDALVLDSVRCFLSAGEAGSADALLAPLLKWKPSPQASLYDAWVRLCRGQIDSAAVMLRSWVPRSDMVGVRPLVLLTLWWAMDDENAGKLLTTEFPSSPEASIVRVEAVLLPGAFWYFLPRPLSADAGNAAPAVTPPVQTADKTAANTPSADDTDNGKALWQQIGFFRNEAYAQDLMTKLRQAGFIPEILRQPRPSGTVYLAVVVRENTAGTIGTELKNSGFECFPIFE